MNRSLSAATFALAALVVLGQAGSASAGETYGSESKPDLFCGPKSLLLVCRSFGVKANLNELAKLSGKNEKGTTLSGLRWAARRKGLLAEGMKIGIDELSTLNTPVIAHLWSNHFVVLDNAGTEGMRVIDPSKRTTDSSKPGQSMTMADFKAAYSGFALLVSRDKNSFPKSEANGPDLRLDTYSCDLGYANDGAKIERIVNLRNVGNADLTISELRSTCGCMTATMGDRSIPPGGVKVAKLAFDTKGLSGGQEKELYVQSNDPISPLVVVEVSVLVKPNTVGLSARNVDYQSVRRSQGAERTLYINDPGDGSLKVNKVESDSPALTTLVALRESRNKEHPGYKAVVHLKPGVPLGEFRAGLTIYTNHPKEPVVKVPVTASITGDVETFPQMFFMGQLTKGQEAARSITVSTMGKAPLAIETVDSPFDYVTVAVAPKAKSKSYTVCATLRDTAPLGYIRGDVVIHTNNREQPDITVPLYALVRDK